MKDVMTEEEASERAYWVLKHNTKKEKSKEKAEAKARGGKETHLH